MQLCNDRDPHGNVQVSLIETEKMLAEMVATKLKAMKAEGKFNGKFSTQVHFFGYEGRCAAPSNYDADYCYSLGYNAAALIGAGRTGYMSSVRNTTKPASEWIAGGIPVTMMMNIERRHGHDKPVIRKALVELDGKPFAFFASKRGEWAKETAYVYPGPIQYFRAVGGLRSRDQDPDARAEQIIRTAIMEDTRIDIEYVAALARLGAFGGAASEAPEGPRKHRRLHRQPERTRPGRRRTDRACGRADERLARGRGRAVVRP